jgi:hypothetical protein
MWVGLKEGVPQGLKPTSFLAVCGTTKVKIIPLTKGVAEVSNDA